MKKLESPQEYVNRIVAEMPDGSHKKVAKRAGALGYKMSAGFVHNVASGAADNPSVKLIKALAAGLGRPEDEVFAVFRGKPISEENSYKEGLFAVLGREYDQLAPRDQKELRPAIDMLTREVQRRLK